MRHEKIIKLNNIHMKYIILSLTVIAAVGLLSSCKSKTAITKIDGDEVRFSLFKGACFGQCPSYEMVITQNGKATFEGRSFTDKLGTYEKQLTKDELKTLENSFADSDFSQLQDDYPSQLVDLPMVKIGYNAGAGMKTISGKEDRPESLMQLQFALERIADSGGWILIKAQSAAGSTKKPEVTMIYDEVIIEPVPGTQIAKWLDSMSEQKVRLIKKIAPTLNYYLITYDQSIIAPQQFLKLLQSDKQIKTAEFNKKTTSRDR